MFEKIELCYNNLEKLNLKKGYRIGIIAPSSPEWIISYLAIQKMNATAVLLDYSLEKDETLKLVEKSDLRAVILSENVKQKLGIIPNMPNINIHSFGELFEDSISKVRETKIEESYQISSIIYILLEQQKQLQV